MLHALPAKFIVIKKISVYALLKLHLCHQMELVFLAIDQITGIKEIDYVKHALKDLYMIIKEVQFLL